MQLESLIKIYLVDDEKKSTLQNTLQDIYNDIAYFNLREL